MFPLSCPVGPARPTRYMYRTPCVSLTDVYISDAYLYIYISLRGRSLLGLKCPARPEGVGVPPWPDG